MEEDGYLQHLVGFDARTADQQGDADIKLVELPLVNGQRELTCVHSVKTGGRFVTR